MEDVAVQLLVKLAVAVVAVFSVTWLLQGFTHRVSISVRESEEDENQTTPPPSRQVLAWHHVHVRVDVAALVVVGPQMTNGLLAAILAVLVIS